MLKINKKDFFKVIALILVSMISIVTYNLWSLDSLSIFILIDVAIVLFVLFKKENPFNFLFLFASVLALFHFGQVFLHVFGLPITTSNAYDLYGMYSGKGLTETLFYCIIGFNLVCTISFFCTSLNKKKTKNISRMDLINYEQDKTVTYKFGKYMFWALIIPIIIFDVTFISAGLSSGYMARYTYEYAFLSNLDVFFPISIICIIACGNDKRKWKGYYYFALFRIFLQLIFVGNRSALIIYLLLYVFTVQNFQIKKNNHKAKNLKYIIAGIMLCVLISFVAVIRGGDRISLETFFGEYNVLSLFFSEFGSTLITPILAREYVEKFGLIFGKNYLGALAILLPFSNKYLSGVREYMNVGALLNPYSPLEGALGGSLFADMIISFGNIGLLFSIPLGIIVSKISNVFSGLKIKSFNNCLSIYFAFSILLYARGNAEDLGLAAKRCIYIYLIYLVYRYVRNRRRIR
ncbi:O-antigen polysaccharide polymerase Wzy [Thomasclavelia spiroformis]|uniref:O-antigen polysaccharide polymerase Wzy n=1 Tax=Thomasclavelia spiroformis TaxID=29348 RepID=UPI000B5813E0|nr:O-antigen polysaccharide polymerase Wzy [Thomasclavelia spiroformis]OUO70304.1 hypothetical protein B5F64_06535 [Thomasclavelia spiroformis]